MVSMEVKLWGGPFEKFTKSISFDKDLYKHYIMGSRAHASMLARQGLIKEDHKNIILKGLDEIEGQIERGEFVCQTDREDVHMNIDAAPTDLVAEPAKKLHTSCSRNEQLARYAARLLDGRKIMNFFSLGACAFAGTGLPIDRFMNPEALGSIAPMRNRPNKDNDEGSCGGGRGGNGKDNDEGSCGGARGGNGIWIRTLTGVGIVIGGAAGLYLVYKTGQAIEREIVGVVREWKEAGFPALVNVKIDKVGLKFSIY